MSDKSKFPSLNDYLLAEQSGKTCRVKLMSLEKILLPIAEGGPVEDLENEIDEMKTYLTGLSVDFAASHQTISEIDEMYERKTATDYMLSDPSILKSETISKTIADADIATIDDVEAAYAIDEALAENSFMTANSKIDKWMY